MKNQQKDAFSLFPEKTGLPISDLTFSAFCSLLEEIIVNEQIHESRNSTQKNLDPNELDSDYADYDGESLSVLGQKKILEIFHTLDKCSKGNLTKKEQELLNNLIIKYS